jgi:hypothetical protein
MATNTLVFQHVNLGGGGEHTIQCTALYINPKKDKYKATPHRQTAKNQRFIFKYQNQQLLS